MPRITITPTIFIEDGTIRYRVQGEEGGNRT
jgi:hypothetical protein